MVHTYLGCHWTPIHLFYSGYRYTLPGYIGGESLPWVEIYIKKKALPS
jgi:hypothetical protein